MANHSVRLISSAALLKVAVLTTVIVGCSGGSDSPDTNLSLLTTEGGINAMYPSFSEGTYHYAVKCDPDGALTVVATAADPNAEISIDGSPSVPSSAQATLENPGGEKDVPIKVINEGRTAMYTVHCLAPDFPDIQVLRTDPSVTPDLMLVAPKFSQDGNRKSYLAVLDNNGVPHFRRKIDSTVNDFKRHSNGLYSYALLEGTNEFGLRDFVIVILDEEFNEIDRRKTVGLNHTDSHDFIITDEGNDIFISYHSTIRDLSAYGLTEEETVGDSVIREVAPDGTVVFEWSSWGHIDLDDCIATGYPRFPSDYAHLNSISLAPDGDLIASFRGCAQVLKIDRPTGSVVWRLGGSVSDYLIVGDAFEEFCGQHTALETSANVLLMFDNGGYCLGTRETDFGLFSRILEYRLDPITGQAHFQRDHSLYGIYQEYTRSQGSVQLLQNGNWFVSWGNGPEMSITEITETGKEIFQMKILFDAAIAVTYRAYRDAGVIVD